MSLFNLDPFMITLEKALDRLAHGHYLLSITKQQCDDSRYCALLVKFVDGEEFRFPPCVVPEYLITEIEYYHKLRKIYQYHCGTMLNDFLQDRFADYPEEPFIKSVKLPQ